MNIHEDAVEAAADEIDDAVGGGTDEGWADRTARAALEAAAPLLMAQALRDMAVKRWICEVVRSGYHNGAHCSPADPHEGWNCGYFYEYTYCVPAAEIET